MTIFQANDYLDLHLDELVELAELSNKIEESTELSAYLENARREIYDEGISHDVIEERYGKLVPDDAFHGLFYILVGVAQLENTIQFYKKKNIPEKILCDTLKDVSLWIRNYKKYNGYLGLASRYWIFLGFAGKVFRLGRMEFEMVTIQEELDLPGLKKGDPVLEGHVPQGEPLDHDEVMKSYRDAFAFFEKYFDYHPKAVHLYTWLLDPELRNILDPESNILKWANDATLIPTCYEGSNIGRFVFGMKEIDLKTAPRDTSLRRKILERMEQGAIFKDHAGIIMAEKILN